MHATYEPNPYPERMFYDQALSSFFFCNCTFGVLDVESSRGGPIESPMLPCILIIGFHNSERLVASSKVLSDSPEGCGYCRVKDENGNYARRPAAGPPRE